MQAEIEQRVIKKRVASNAVHPAGVAAENFDKMGYFGQMVQGVVDSFFIYMAAEIGIKIILPGFFA